MRVLSGAEEARLGASAAIEDVPKLDGVVADLGGGSLQLTSVRGGRIAGTASVPIGTVRMTRAFLHGDPPEPRELRLLRAEIRARLDDALPPPRRGDEMVGLGGTIRTLARMYLSEHRGRRRHRHGMRIGQADITAIRARLEAAPLRERRRFRGLKAERVDTIVAGAVIVEETLMYGGYLTMVVSTRGVRDGLLLREAFGDDPMTADNAPLVNRELSWLEFNRRVLEEAQDETVPLLERVKFLGIFSSNLDEYYMVRVAGLKRQIAAGDRTIGPDGLTPSETMLAVAARIHDLVEEQHRFFIETLVPRLEAHGIRLIRPGQETPEQARYLLDYFQRGLLPVVTPLAVDPGHPFPHLANRALCLAVSLRPIAESPLPRATLSLLHVPPTQVAPRFVALPAPADQSQFMLLEDVLRLHLPRLYEGYEILSSHGIRVTRDAEVEIPRGRTEDLMVAIEAGLRERRMGDAVRLQYDPNLPLNVLTTLVSELELGPTDLSEEQGFAAFADLAQLYTAVDRPRLKERQLPPHPVAAFERAPDVWTAIRHGDILVHHPYHTFDVVTRLVQEAAADPAVLAIKMTLYRVSPTSPIAQALARAAEMGKEVTVLVELQARFDEEANIHWARALAEVGAHVVYGLVGLQDPLQGLSHRPAGSATGSAGTATSRRATTMSARPACTPTSGSSRAGSHSART